MAPTTVAPHTKRDPTHATHSKRGVTPADVEKENFLLDACLKLRDALDGIKGNARMFFQQNVSTDEDAYIDFEDLLIENLQVEINEAFDLDGEDSESDSDAGSYSDYTSSEASGSEGSDSGSETNGDNTTANEMDESS